MHVKWCLFALQLLLTASVSAQSNLALSATPTASASSSGAYGPTNWTDGVINGSFFGWVGTDPATANFPQPAWMGLEWLQPQQMNRIVLYQTGTNFMPPSGNAVVFSGSAQLQYWDGNAWVNLQALQASGSYGDSMVVNFNLTTTQKLRISQISTPAGAHNPGFDEWRVYQIQNDTTDAAIAAVSVSTLVGPTGNLLQIKARIANRGNVMLQNPALQYEINTNPVTGPISASLPQALHPGDDTLFTFNDAQPSQGLNGRELCVWVHAANDIDRSNDTLCILLDGLNTAVAPFQQPSPIVYPNPFRTVLYLIPTEPGNFVKCSIYDLKGRLMVATEGQINQWQLPVGLPKGMYVLQIEQKGVQYIYKIMKD